MLLTKSCFGLFFVSMFLAALCCCCCFKVTRHTSILVLYVKYALGLKVYGCLFYFKCKYTFLARFLKLLSKQMFYH